MPGALSDNFLSLPDPADRSHVAVWDGHDFVVNGRRERVLAYEVLPSGWTDELNRLHEETAGSEHFIDVASRIHALTEIARCVPADRATILEIGCSSGYLLADIRQKMPQHFVIGSDYTGGTLQTLATRMPGLPLVQFDLTRCPLPDDFADIVILLNVLEHIDDHEAAIGHLFRITRPGGAVIIELPAGSGLYDVYDRALMHRRRYDMPNLVELLQRAGFVVQRKSHLGFFLYPLFYLAKRLNQRRYPEDAAGDEKKIVAAMIVGVQKSSSLMRLVMKMEQMLRPHIYLPFGVRCLVTARKSAGHST